MLKEIRRRVARMMNGKVGPASLNNILKVARTGIGLGGLLAPSI
jgi:hypothetical protein